MRVNLKIITKENLLCVVIWLISFNLSIVLQSFGIANQGIAFILIYCVLTVIRLLTIVLRLYAVTGILMASFLGFFFAVVYGIIFLLSWVLSIVFQIEYSIIFQVLSLGYAVFSKTIQ